jgi:hypothetical protein
MSSFEVKLVGDWREVKHIFSRLSLFATKLRDNVAAGIAEEYYNALKGHFENQDLPLQPLSSWYREWKAKKGLDTRILVATGQMLSEMKIHELGIGQMFVGIRGGKKHQRSGLDVALLALIHEYGALSRGLPARPVYRLTVQELRGKLNKVVGDIVQRTRVEVFGR